MSFDAAADDDEPNDAQDNDPLPVGLLSRQRKRMSETMNKEGAHMKYQQQDNKGATTDTIMSKNKGTTPTPQGDNKKANSRNDNEPGQGMTQTNTTTTRMTTKDDNKDHDMTKIQTTMTQERNQE